MFTRSLSHCSVIGIIRLYCIPASSLHYWLRLYLSLRPSSPGHQKHWLPLANQLTYVCHVLPKFTVFLTSHWTRMDMNGSLLVRASPYIARYLKLVPRWRTRSSNRMMIVVLIVRRASSSILAGVLPTNALVDAGINEQVSENRYPPIRLVST